MRLVITGGTGFLGSHLVEAAHRRGLEAMATTRGAPSPGQVRADLSDAASLRAAFTGAEVVIANAALSPGRKAATPEDFDRANLEGTRHTLDAAAAAGVRRVVLVSTVAVYRTRLLRRLDEQGERIDPDQPRFDWNQLTTQPHYSRSKARAERLAWSMAHDLGLELVVLRPGPIYGPRDEKLTLRYASWLARPLALVPTARVPHVHAGDVASAALEACCREVAGRAFNVAGDSVPVIRAVQALREALGARTVLVPLPAPIGPRFDDGRARAALGFQCRPVEEGMVDTAAWLQARRADR